MTEITIEYNDVRSIDDETHPARPKCAMIAPGEGVCGRDGDYTFEVVVNGDEKPGRTVACSGCFTPPDGSDLPTSFSQTLTDSDLYE